MDQPRTAVLLAELESQGKRLRGRIDVKRWFEYERLRKRVEDAVVKNAPQKCLALIALLRFLQELGPQDPTTKSLMNAVLELAAILGCGNLITSARRNVKRQ